MKTRIVRIEEEIMQDEKTAAAENRIISAENNQILINVMASPGAGKTSLILALMKQMKDSFAFSVLEGDVDSTVDADKIIKEGFEAVQIQTGGSCHLSPFMVKKGLNLINSDRKDNKSEKKEIIFIENIGNLICPVSHDLGEILKLVILSVPEGDDKPWKYPAIFKAADVIVLNKTDNSDFAFFRMTEFKNKLEFLNQGVPLFPVSCRNGEGISALADHIKLTLAK